MAWRRASSAVEVWRAAAAVLGRPKCILETKRVDRRPEKSAVSSDLEGGRGEREGKLELRLVEVEVAVAGEAAPGLAALRGEGRGLVRETLWEDQW